MTYELILDVNSSDEQCDAILGIEEGILFEVRLLNLWIPWRITFYNDTADFDTTVSYRGFTVPAFGRRAARVTENVSIYGDRFCDATEIKFRWLQFAIKETGSVKSDIWAINIVKATLITRHDSTNLTQIT